MISTTVAKLIGKIEAWAQAAIEQQTANGLYPADLGLIAWNKDPANLTSGVANVTVTGRQVLIRTRLPGCTVTNIHTGVRVIGSGFSTGNLVGLFDSAGAPLGVSGECTGADGTGWAQIGFKTHALTTPAVISPGIYYIGFLMNASGLPSLNGLLPDTTGGTLSQMGTSSTRPAYTDTTVRSAFAGGYTLSGLAVTSSVPWFAIS